jgi:hypothetical protein
MVLRRWSNFDWLKVLFFMDIVALCPLVAGMSYGNVSYGFQNIQILTLIHGNLNSSNLHRYQNDNPQFLKFYGYVHFEPFARRFLHDNTILVANFNHNFQQFSKFDLKGSQ